MEVQFQNDDLYAYDEVPQEIYDQLMQQQSKGSFFRREIARSFKYKKIGKAGDVDIERIKECASQTQLEGMTFLDDKGEICSGEGIEDRVKFVVIEFVDGQQFCITLDQFQDRIAEVTFTFVEQHQTLQ